MKTLPLFLALLTLALPATLLADTTRPNVLLIINDDQGYGDASSFGSKDLQTPHFDALAASGIRFTKFRVNPLCARPAPA